MVGLIWKKNGQSISGFEAMFRQRRSNTPDASV